MKKLLIAAVLSVFGMSAAAAYACDGMKGQAKDQTSAQGKKDTKKSDKADDKT